jgi:ribosomal protein S18 acetylase RimI-like enzyme
MAEEIILSPLSENDIDQIVSSFNDLGWNKPRAIYESYLSEQVNNKRSIFVAKKHEKFFGYVTVKWESDYPHFKKKRIPEISDLNVLPNYRNKGLGSKLILASENLAKEKAYKHIGLGVGMTADYGNAQRLYVKLGYVPDGHGLHYKNRPVSYGEEVIVDDDLVIYLIKELQ